jgi:hypothetical protein
MDWKNSRLNWLIADNANGCPVIVSQCTFRSKPLTMMQTKVLSGIVGLASDSQCRPARTRVTVNEYLLVVIMTAVCAILAASDDRLLWQVVVLCGPSSRRNRDGGFRSLRPVMG